MGIIKKYPALIWGLSTTLLFLFLWLFGLEFLDVLELKYYDARMKLRGDAHSQSEIVLVDIDNVSVENLGRWPWSRSIIAEGINVINKGNPKIIGLNLILSEAEKNSGLNELKKLEGLFSNTILPKSGKEGERFIQAIKASGSRLNNDEKLKTSITKAGNVILPAFFNESAHIMDDAEEENILFAAQTIQNVNIPAGMQYPRAGEISIPIPSLFSAAMGVGHINFTTDLDGTVRKERLVYEYKGLYVPSYPLRLAAGYLNVPVKELNAELGISVTLGNFDIPLTRYSEFLISFKGKSGSFKKFSFFDVLNNKIPLSHFKNKIVLISPSAAGIMNPLNTPSDISMPIGEYSANTIWTILNKKFINQPAWGSFIELFLILFLGIIITFVFPKIKAITSSLTFIIILSSLLFGATYLFISDGLWIQITYPVTLLVTGYIGIISIRFFLTEAGKEKVEGESAETNRMLGVSFQEQGMLDMAFDKFRRVPMDDQMLDILYNLAQDYERKRQLNKAASVYSYMTEYKSDYKDINDRKSKLMQASETMVFGDGFLGGGSSDKDISATNTGTRPTLGRYEIIKQLGKGAMGIVYLGKDPRINRTTAIKTIRFTDDFAPEDAEKMKETFFREAESAGTLSHPNIVTIYDAGNEQDIAFIAMEYLEGSDFDEFTKPDNLLPMRKVIDYVADIADGLGYAHDKGIVHRDIKPANIMLLKSGVVKITDFGIARITATSQTMTGVIKGTPHYMSPEQFSGKKVDGRSDIFSLGTMLFRLLTGQLPFSGDNPATLMHKILNEKQPDPRTINPKIVKPLVAIMNKALEKDRNIRYQTGTAMAANLRELGKKIDIVMAKKGIK